MPKLCYSAWSFTFDNHAIVRDVHVYLSIQFNWPNIISFLYNSVTTNPSVNLIPKASTRVRGNIWPAGGLNCAPIGFSRNQMQWLQVDLLITYGGVTGQCYANLSSSQISIPLCVFVQSLAGIIGLGSVRDYTSIEIKDVALASNQ
jgi:hypothetical protein